MKKSFRIISCKFNEIAEDGRGSLEYLVVDELGVERKISATAQRGFFKKIKSVKAVYKREIPLVKALAKTAVGHTVQVDFTQFNTENTRKIFNQKIKRETKNEAFVGSDVSELKSLLFDGTRLAQLTLMGVMGFIVILSVKSIS